MPHHINQKREKVIETVRRELEGDAALEFIRQSGYAMSISGITRHLRSMGGRGDIQKLINDSKSNVEILEQCFPNENLDEFKQDIPDQGELFSADSFQKTDLIDAANIPIFETTKISVRMPADLFTAIRLAAKAEKKSQNQLIIDLLTSALSEMPDITKIEKD